MVHGSVRLIRTRQASSLLSWTPGKPLLLGEFRLTGAPSLSISHRNNNLRHILVSSGQKATKQKPNSWRYTAQRLLSSSSSEHSNNSKKQSRTTLLERLQRWSTVAATSTARGTWFVLQRTGRGLANASKVAMERSTAAISKGIRNITSNAYQNVKRSVSNSTQSVRLFVSEKVNIATGGLSTSFRQTFVEPIQRNSSRLGY